MRHEILDLVLLEERKRKREIISLFMKQRIPNYNRRKTKLEPRGDFLLPPSGNEGEGESKVEVEAMMGGERVSQ